LVHADPSAELPLLAVALDATFHLRSALASRSVAAGDFYHGYLLTDIAPDELLVAIDFRLPPADCGWCCTEIARRHGDFAIVAVAVLLDFGRDGSVNFARVALGGVGPAPVRAAAAEEALMGMTPAPELFRQAGDAAGNAVDPPADIHASAAYRRHLTGVLVRRALATAASRVKGQA
jgi:CO/xanthine dehydrogenase FAD-binding subunit